MKRFIPIIIVIIVVILGVILSIRLIDNNTTNNNQSNESNANIITIDEMHENNFFVYHKVEINPSNKTLKLSYMIKNKGDSNFISELRIYDDIDNLIETIYIPKYDYNNNYITLNYTNDLSNATHYAIDLDFGPMTG